jgi:sugar/nucleoside kinase (ribokinase family)
VFANEEEAVAFSGKSVEDSLSYIAKKTKIAVVKVGSKGSFVMQGTQKEVIKPFPAHCIDTTGAGDLYASGFLYAYVKGYDLPRCGKTGSYLAAQIVEETGSKFSQEKWDKILKNIDLL